MTQLEDSKIISLFFERSEQAVEELNRKYGNTIRKTAANILSDRLDVEECVNESEKSSSRRSTPGSNAFVPSVVGLIIAGEVIKDIIAAEQAAAHSRFACFARLLCTLSILCFRSFALLVYEIIQQ